eukprot:COSAG01_NODE_46426_length_400_cov_1.029900_1_plen_31_part_10
MYMPARNQLLMAEGDGDLMGIRGKGGGSGVW